VTETGCNDLPGGKALAATIKLHKTKVLDALTSPIVLRDDIYTLWALGCAIELNWGYERRDQMTKKRSKSTKLSAHGLWEQFAGDQALLESHNVTIEELEFLRTVSLFGKLKSVDDLLFILQNIRDESKTMGESRGSQK
jgi:hypothetical protein